LSTALEGLFRGQDDNLVRLMQRKTDGLSPNDIRQSLKRVDVRFEFPAVSACSAKAWRLAWRVAVMM
jgi:hypothetical protein